MVPAPARVPALTVRLPAGASRLPMLPLTIRVPPFTAVGPVYLFRPERVHAPEFVLTSAVSDVSPTLFEITPLHSPLPAPISLRLRVLLVAILRKFPLIVSLPLSDWMFQSEPPVDPEIMPLKVLLSLTFKICGVLSEVSWRQ